MPSFYLKIVCFITFLFVVTYNTTSNADDEHNRRLLIDHIKGNNISEVNRLINTEVDLNAATRGTGLFAFSSAAHTPLTTAILWGRELIIDMLLEAGADPNIHDEYDRLPLMWAIKENKFHIAKILVARTNLNLPDEHGDTPLMWAAANAPYPRFIKILLEAGADPNTQNSKDGKTALMKAIDNVHSEMIVKILLKAEADPDTQDNRGETALMMASRNNDADLIKILLKAKAAPYITNKNNETAMAIAQKMHGNFVNNFFPGIDLGGAFLSVDNHLDAIRALNTNIHDRRQEQQECPRSLSE